MDEKPSVMEIFNDLLYEPCHVEPEITEETFLCSDTPPDLVKIYQHCKNVRLTEEALVNGHKMWSASSRQLRANTLHKIWEDLKRISKSLVKLKDEISPFIDYFDFYCDTLHQTEEYIKWRPEGIIHIMIHNYTGMFVVAATVSAALAAGCSVIIDTFGTIEEFFIFLQAIFLKAGLPEGVFVMGFDERKAPTARKITKVISCGSYSSVQRFYPSSFNKSFNFFCPNNTAAFVLDSGDLNAAADKIISETWGKEYPFFAISNIVVQESIYQEFFHKLKSKMRQFMAENKYCRKFIIPKSTQDVKEIISEAHKAGALVEEIKGCGECNPTVIVNHHNRDDDRDVPVLNVLLCRTAKEGVALLNSCRYVLGTSVWSETSSQALEISSQLISPNVWINCHGAFDPGVPLQLSGDSGSGVLGGIDGILEYLSLREDDPVEGLQNNEDENLDLEEPQERTDKISAPAHRAFTSWRQDKNKRLYLKQIANSGMEHLSDMIDYYAHSRYFVHFSDGSHHGDFSIVRNKIPIGVILLIVNETEIEEKSIASLITPALALGNAVIVLLKQAVASVQSLISTFNKILPENVLNVVVGIKRWFHLISDPNIQAVWLYGRIITCKKSFVKSPKRLWIVPEKVPVSQALFRKECLQNKIVWLTKVDQFP